MQPWGKEEALEKRLRGRGERAGRLLRESTDKDANGDCKHHHEVQGTEGGKC